MGNTTGPEDRWSAGSLAEIRDSLAAANPELYRQIALYLQVLRSLLPNRVEQACFHLSTQVHARRYLGLTATKRLELHRRLRRRVEHCSSLLTVEQLAALAGTLELEALRNQNQRQRRLLHRLLNQAEDPEGSEGRPREDDGPDGSPGNGSDTPPPGSVHLSLAPPLDLRVLGWRISPEWISTSAQETPDGAEEEERFDDGTFPSAEAEGLRELEDLNAAGADDPAFADLEGDLLPEDGSPADEQLARDDNAAALMAVLMEGLLRDGRGLDGDLNDEEPPDPTDARLASRPEARLTPAISATPGQLAPPDPADHEGGPEPRTPGEPSIWEGGALPRDPVELLRWMEGLEQALKRRLRDLSHGINIDLLRFGLSRGLLPLNLLEAVLKGEVETLPCPANVVRLQLPFGLSPGAPPLQAIAILLRTADLEMEEPRLRTFRRRIHPHRPQVRKMAPTSRR
ncbi:MAG: hypothetical protein ACKO0M_03830, partial [Cyanobium sp.]